MVPFSESKAKQTKARVWICELYPDNPDHVAALQSITDDSVYAYCLHDKDVSADGTIKKAHWHVVFRFNNPRWMLALARYLGIETRFLFPCIDIRARIRYLIHLDNPEKFQYTRDELKSNFPDSELNDYLANDHDPTEDEDILSLLDLLDGIDDVIDLRSFLRLVCKNNLYDVYRRSQYTFIHLLRDHNDQWRDILSGLDKE